MVHLHAYTWPYRDGATIRQVRLDSEHVVAVELDTAAFGVVQVQIPDLRAIGTYVRKLGSTGAHVRPDNIQSNNWYDSQKLGALC